MLDFLVDFIDDLFREQLPNGVIVGQFGCCLGVLCLLVAFGVL